MSLVGLIPTDISINAAIAICAIMGPGSALATLAWRDDRVYCITRSQYA